MSDAVFDEAGAVVAAVIDPDDGTIDEQVADFRSELRDVTPADFDPPDGSS